MASIEISGLDAWDSTLASLLDEFPDALRELHERVGEAAKRTLDAEISSSGLNDRHGNVKRWQVVHIGSRGGYAAVRTKGAKEGGKTGPDGEAAITNYLEGGHALPPPARSGRRRVRVPRVSGYHFYSAASAAFEAKAIQEAERFADELARRLEGNA